MSRYIVLLKYNGRLDVPDEKDNRDQTVVEELQDLLLKDEIEYLGWHKDHGEDFDHQDGDEFSLLGADETYFEIRMEVDINIEFDESGGRNILQYISAALDFRPYHISNCYEREYENFIKTVIEITITSNAEL